MEASAMEHVNVKVFAREPERVDLAAAVPVFHRWIQEDACEELLIDVADYRHVPGGPGVVLVGHQANYSLDLGAGRLGLLYNRKARLSGSARDRIACSLRSALAACRRLEGEPEFAGALRFDAGAVEITINDRLLAPNTAESLAVLKAELEEALAGIYGVRSLAIERVESPAERLRVSVRAGGPLDVEEILNAAGAVRP